jgi:hypothetical protein
VSPRCAKKLLSHRGRISSAGAAFSRLGLYFVALGIYFESQGSDLRRRGCIYKTWAVFCSAWDALLSHRGRICSTGAALQDLGGILWRWECTLSHSGQICSAGVAFTRLGLYLVSLGIYFEVQGSDLQRRGYIYKTWAVFCSAWDILLSHRGRICSTGVAFTRLGLYFVALGMHFEPQGSDLQRRGCIYKTWAVFCSAWDVLKLILGRRLLESALPSGVGAEVGRWQGVVWSRAVGRGGVGWLQQPTLLLVGAGRAEWGAASRASSLPVPSVTRAGAAATLFGSTHHCCCCCCWGGGYLISLNSIFS